MMPNPRVVTDRPASRLLVVDGDDRVLLFRFDHRRGALAGQAFWATPGGGLQPGESFEDAACRELREETGLALAHPGPQIAQRTAAFTLPDGTKVEADERYFLVRVGTPDVSDAHRTAGERRVMTTHRWWHRSDILTTSQQIWPETLTAMLVDANIWPASS